MAWRLLDQLFSDRLYRLYRVCIVTYWSCTTAICECNRCRGSSPNISPINVHVCPFWKLERRAEAGSCGSIYLSGVRLGTGTGATRWRHWPPRAENVSYMVKQTSARRRYGYMVIWLQ